MTNENIKITKGHSDYIEINGIFHERYAYDSYEYDETGETIDMVETKRIESIFKNNQTFFQKILCKLINILVKFYNR